MLRVPEVNQAHARDVAVPTHTLDDVVGLDVVVRHFCYCMQVLHCRDHLPKDALSPGEYRSALEPSSHVLCLRDMTTPDSQ